MPDLIPGGERELLFMVGMVVLLPGVVAMDWIAAAVGAALWVVGAATPFPRGRRRRPPPRHPRRLGSRP